MVLLLLTFCLLLLPLWESVIVLCFVVLYFMSILVLQSSWWGRESWLLCLSCLPGVSWWLSGSSSRCHGVVCCLRLWYFPDHTNLLFLKIPLVYKEKSRNHKTVLLNAMFESTVEPYVYEVSLVTLKITKRQVKSVAIDMIDVVRECPNFSAFCKHFTKFTDFLVVVTIWLWVIFRYQSVVCQKNPGMFRSLFTIQRAFP